MSDRTTWLHWLERIAGPVIEAMAEDRLSASLPPIDGRGDRTRYAAAEAFCRSFTGLAPWLQHTPQSGTAEAKLHRQYRDRVIAALRVGSDPEAADVFPFDQTGQPLVEAAFLAHGLLRAPSLWLSLDASTKTRLIHRLAASRATAAPMCNWLLFSAIVEAFFASVGAPYDRTRIDHALHFHESWYRGDGVYGDGPELHVDY